MKPDKKYIYMYKTNSLNLYFRKPNNLTPMDEEYKELSPFALVRNVEIIQKQMIYQWENSRQHGRPGMDYVLASVFPLLPKPIPEHETVLISKNNARNKACQTYNKYDGVWPEKHMEPTDYFIFPRTNHMQCRANSLRELITICKNEKETQTWITYNHKNIKSSFHCGEKSKFEFIFGPEDINMQVCSSIQLDSSAEEEHHKPSETYGGGSTGISLEEENMRMDLLLGTINKCVRMIGHL